MNTKGYYRTDFGKYHVKIYNAKLRKSEYKGSFDTKEEAERCANLHLSKRPKKKKYKKPISFKRKLQLLKPIILNRKSAFNYQEWQIIQTHMKL